MMAWIRIRPLAMSWPPELVALRINLGLADEKMGSDPAFARELVHRMGDDVDATAVERLRSGSGTSICCNGRNPGPVAQRSEPRTHNPSDGGSNPPRPIRAEPNSAGLEKSVSPACPETCAAAGRTSRAGGAIL